MRKQLITGLALGLLSMSSFAEDVPDKFHHEAAKLEDQLSAKKPTMIVFSASWCGPCNKMKKNIWNKPEFSKKVESHDFTPFYMDIDSEDNKALVERFKIDSIPTVIYLKADLENQEEATTHGPEDLKVVSQNIEEHFEKTQED